MSSGEPPQQDATRLDPLVEFFSIHAQTIGQTDQQEVGVAGLGIETEFDEARGEALAQVDGPVAHMQNMIGIGERSDGGRQTLDRNGARTFPTASTRSRAA